MFAFFSTINEEKRIVYLRPTLLLLPATVSLDIGVDLSTSLCRVTDIKLLNLLGLDDDDSKVLSCNRVVEIVDFGAESQVLVIIGLRGWFTWWWCLE
jgi:hypothetical protein